MKHPGWTLEQFQFPPCTFPGFSPLPPEDGVRRALSRKCRQIGESEKVAKTLLRLYGTPDPIGLHTPRYEPYVL